MTLGKVAVVVGVGPGTGGSVARRFAAEGYSVALVSRHTESSQPILDQITAKGGKAIIIPADTGKESEVKRAYKEILDKFGASPEVLVYNASGPRPKTWPPPKILEIEPEAFANSFATGVSGAFYWLQQVLPDQVAAGKGTIIFTGATASLRGGPSFGQFSPAKFALRSLAQVAAKEHGPKGIHVAHVIIDGAIKIAGRPNIASKTDDDYLLPDEIAEEYWKLHTQHKSTWSQEMDLRPFTEKF